MAAKKASDKRSDVKPKQKTKPIVSRVARSRSTGRGGRGR